VSLTNLANLTNLTKLAKLAKLLSRRFIFLNLCVFPYESLKLCFGHSNLASRQAYILQNPIPFVLRAATYIVVDRLATNCKASSNFRDTKQFHGNHHPLFFDSIIARWTTIDNKLATI